MKDVIIQNLETINRNYFPNQHSWQIMGLFWEKIFYFKRTCFIFSLLLIGFGVFTYGQASYLQTGKTFERKLTRGEEHEYTIDLKKGEYATCIVNQKTVIVKVDLIDNSGKNIKSFSLNEGYESFPVSIDAAQTGSYKLKIYPFLIPEDLNLPDSVKSSWADQNQGVYTITGIAILTAGEYKQKLEKDHKEDAEFISWIDQRSHEIKNIDAGHGFDDLQPLKWIWKNVQVVGLGEATHGTSEFFRFKHRVFEFLVKEMGFTSFLLEASATRCRYINDYVLYGKGNLDTATAIQGFITWRVDEMRDLIKWMRTYNQSVSEAKKIKFFGYDLQINDMGWKELKQFYSSLNVKPPVNLDSLNMRLDTAEKLVNDIIRFEEGKSIYEAAYQPGLKVLNDLVMNEGQYRYQSGNELYDKNLMNIKLIVQQIESYKGENIPIRDYYMAQNILQLLSRYPGMKAMVWAHNGHIEKREGMMGSYLARVLGNKYYAMGFEFFSGTFQSKNLDIGTISKDWDKVTIGNPPEKSLPWYLNQTGKENFYIDFRNNHPEAIKSYSKDYPMHSFGSVFSSTMPMTTSASLKNFDGLIFIRQSHAARNFNKVYISKYFSESE